MKLNIVVPVPTTLNKLYTNQYTWRKNPQGGKPIGIPSGKRVLTKEGEKYKKDVKTLVERQISNQEWDYNKKAERFIYMDYIVYMNRKGRDSDNLHKLLQDTLKGLIYVDDTTVLTRPNRVLVDRDNPRMEIEIRFVEWVGVFDSEDQMNNCILKCKTCKRFKDGACSVLRDSIDGVINKDFDFDNKICSKYNKNA